MGAPYIFFYLKSGPVPIKISEEKKRDLGMHKIMCRNSNVFNSICNFNLELINLKEFQFELGTQQEAIVISTLYMSQQKKNHLTNTENIIS